MTGAEYLTASVLETLWTETATAFRSELAESKASVQEFLQAQESGLASRRPRPFQPRREPPGRRRAVRVSGDLYDPAVDAGQGAAPAARPGAERVRRRRQQAAAAVVAPAGPARRRRVSVAEGDGRCGRDLSPAAVDARRGVSTADRSPRLEAAGVIVRVPTGMARQSSTTSAGDGHRRGQAAVGSRHGRAARLQDGRDPRRRTADRGGDRATARRVERPSPGARTLGRSRSRQTQPDARRVPRRGDGRGNERPLLRRSDAPPRRRARARRHRRGQRARLVIRSSPGRGWRRRSPAFAIRPNWRNSILAPL